MNIQEICEKYGTEKIFAIIPLRPLRIHFGCIGITSSSDEPISTICTINEKRYKVSEGYKITFKALDKRFGRRHYYQNDFDILVRDKQIIVLATINDEFDYPKESKEV